MLKLLWNPLSAAILLPNTPFSVASRMSMLVHERTRCLVCSFICISGLSGKDVKRLAQGLRQMPKATVLEQVIKCKHASALCTGRLHDVEED
jgi:hypothetical protein